MILKVVKFGHPALRQKGARIHLPLSSEIKKLTGDMFETMYAYKGIGLAAQQVGHALQLTVLDVRGVTDRPSSMEIDGEPVEVVDFMPMVLINPLVTPVGEPLAGPEGCLSFPEIYADITRARSIDVRALDKDGKPIAFRCEGLLARAIQHETDHLNGLLFIDRMDKKTKEEIRPELEVLQAETKAELETADKR